MSQSAAEVSKIVGQVTAKAQADATFRQQYLDNPSAVLAQSGLDVPGGVTVHVIEGDGTGNMPTSSASDVYLLLPTVEEVVQDESLAATDTASCQSTASTCFTVPSCASCVSSASTNSCS